MDTNNLSDSAVKELIQELKNFLKPTTIDIPQLGKYKKEASLVGKRHGIEYKFHVYRGNIQVKYSIHLRFVKNDVHLVRLCINGTKHHNEDGTVVGKNHIHIYKKHNDHIESYAYDLKQFPFDESSELSEGVEKFLSYVNIRERDEKI
ncbi:hypothetical protein GTO83_06780 [Lactobacillus sp. 3B(2020)]|nr:hypothetical protein GTO83_06780 [Lactobacillus sp. 3B(2020)]